MSDRDDGLERRLSGVRWRCSQVRGWIVIDGQPRQPCIVRNFSEGGVQLSVQELTALPARFRLEFDAIDFVIGCEVCHRNNAIVGVRFIDADLKRETAPIWGIGEMLARCMWPKQAAKEHHQSVAA